ncbi:GNAT family N-acetyltransferase [Pseudomonas sp. PB3P13]
MTPFKIRELTSADTEALLAFEIRNREWFESHIDARDPAFYSLSGVAAHIEGYLNDFEIGGWHPFVIEDANQNIVGRANLKSIDSTLSSAEVGYRIDQQLCGKGLATLALRRLIQEAQERWKLKQLIAYVYQDNASSRKVLERCGFLSQQPTGDDNAAAERRFILEIC